ncbi:MAG: RpiB/LacA/LacB family sugar-phosphate isomerase [Candidatus Spechtbacteria bacterium]|nr:RpiB/LacA/LacB family sugar-phosphate isomerase [Candidatus Spechtbacteria bacterium]
MKIFLAADHAGFYLKEKIKEWFEEWGYEQEDMGAFSYDAEDDYPDFIRPVAEKVAEDPENNRGIVLGGSGQGEAMVCNRYKGIRATVYAARKLDLELVKLMREHNDSNVLSLGARFVPEEDAKKVVKIWLETPFPGEERHKRRIAKIDA